MTSPDFSYEELMDLKAADSCLLRELARRYLWVYCQITEPDFYNATHKYLKTICDELQEFWESEEQKYMVLSIPPQHGKSRTCKKFEAWILMNNIKVRFFSISYNEEYATDSSKHLLEEIRQEPEEGRICFKDIAGDIRVKKGEGAVNRWSVEGGFNTWLSASPGSGITGRSADIVCCDDLIKSYEVACNRKELKKIWDWFANTLFSRRSDNNRKMLIVMTRWSKYDLAGEILRRYGDKVKNVVMKAYDPDTDTMLCDDIINKESYEEIKNTVSEEILQANYNQTPIEIKGALYNTFKTYTPEDLDSANIKRVSIVCDTADEGSDWLCSICFAETFDKKAYLLDVYFTKEPVEVTIPGEAEFIYKNKADRSIIESNNGGKIFALSVRKELRDKYKSNQLIKWFHQARNKEARIISTAYEVQQRIYYPTDWETRWRAFSEAVKEYQREGKNEHDDASDTLSMVIESIDGKLKTV